LRGASAEKGDASIIDCIEAVTDHTRISAPGKGFALHRIGICKASEIIGIHSAGDDLGADLLGTLLPVKGRGRAWGGLASHIGGASHSCRNVGRSHSSL